MTEEQLNNLLEQLAGEAGSGITIQMTGSAAALILKVLLGKGCESPKQETPESEEKYVNCDEAADIVDECGNRIYNWGKRGRISTMRQGNRILYKYSDLIKIRDEKKRRQPLLKADEHE